MFNYPIKTTIPYRSHYRRAYTADLKPEYEVAFTMYDSHR